QSMRLELSCRCRVPPDVRLSDPLDWLYDLRANCDHQQQRILDRSQSTNIPIAAANIAMVVITTTTRDSIELGWSCISFRSQATKRMPTRRKGASTPLMTAVQKSALTGFICKKSIVMPTRVEKMSTV